MTDFIEIGNGELRLTLCQPGSYYQGTRFDWAGVFRRIEYAGQSFCDEWFDQSDPFRHDNVCGPSEEFFGTIGFDSARPGDSFLKVGVGLLRREDSSDYDWFHRYEIVDAGERELSVAESIAVFVHRMPGIYEYRKTVEALPGGRFIISHKLENLGRERLDLKQYCHNFFTFGYSQVGQERSVEFNAPVSGQWRSDSVNAEMSGARVWITAPMNQGEKAYIGNLCCQTSGGYGFTLRAGSMAAAVKCSQPLAPSVLWSNHRVFCPEPYLNLSVEPGRAIEWEIEYQLWK